MNLDYRLLQAYDLILSWPAEPVVAQIHIPAAFRKPQRTRKAKILITSLK